EEETFSWILETNGEMDLALQRLVLRVNAYDFSGLSEEVLGDIYQNFLPPDKRKRLGEFYTPKEVVDLILEDLGLTKRRLTNGGPERWREFVQFLTDKATALVKVASLDLSQAYAEPFEEETFSWILETNGEMDLALQRLVLRVNAYDFSG
ncbi:SAM-dependent DNA methyltransferase, partial [Streptococcus pneumoniae]